MIKKIQRKSSSTHAQTEIKPGDIWKDSHGKKVIIRSVIPMRVYYDRDDYEHICSMPRFQFIEAFTPETGSKKSLYTVSLNPLKALAGIRAKIRSVKGTTK